MKKTISYLGLCLLVFLVVVFTTTYYADLSVEKLKEKYTNEHSQFININGLDVHYRIEGEGPNLVLVHGTAASLHTWDGWTDILKEDFRIIRFDLPAFGLTGPSLDRDYSIAGYTDFLHDLTQAIGLDSFSIAGNSLGGAIAWSYAAQWPDQIEKLILIDATGIPDDQGDPAVFKMARNPILGVLFEYLTPKSFIAKNMKEVYFDETKVDEALVNRYHQMALREGNRVAFRDRAKVINPDITDQLERITAPSLIIWGEEDAWIPVESAYVFDEKIANSDIYIMENMGHVPMEEAPEITANISKEFLLNY
jgi:pimeloyl-ACP methyl ester carboxylesterase